MSVLLAVGSPHLSKILRKHLKKSRFNVIEDDVLHINYLQEFIDVEEPSIIILHDQYLPSDFEGEEREEEILRLIEYWRNAYDDKFRVVYMCEREKRDPFLAQLVARNVLDIFNERQISIGRFLNQLSEPPRYANVSRFGIGTIDLVPEEESNETEVEQDDSFVDNTLSDNTTISRNGKDSKNLKFWNRNDNSSLKQAGGNDKKNSKILINIQQAPEVEKIKVSIDRKIIVVVSPFERSGSTFISHQLAYQVAKQGIGVTYYENPLRRPYTYDRLGGHLSVPDYQSLFSAGDEKLENSHSYWKVDGVSIQALNPSLEQPLEERDLSITNYLRMFLSAHDTPYLIVDIGSDENREIYDEIIEVASHIVVVLDGDIPNLEWFEQYKLSPSFSWIHGILDDYRTTTVANRFSPGMENVLPVEDFIAVPSFDDEWIFNSQLAAEFTFSKKDAIKKQDSAFRELLEQIVPKSDLNKSTPKFRNIFPKVKIENKN